VLVPARAHLDELANLLDRQASLHEAMILASEPARSVRNPRPRQSLGCRLDVAQSNPTEALHFANLSTIEELTCCSVRAWKEQRNVIAAPEALRMQGEV